MKSFKFIFFWILVNVLGSSFCWSNDVTLPLPMGRYAVGTKALELMDSKRTMMRGSQSQRWMVQAFYPTDEEKGQTYPYMPETLKDGMIQGSPIFSFGHPNAQLSSHGSFPVIIFIHGLGEIRQRYTILCEELASQGYIVLSMDQPYMSSYTRFLDGTIIVPTFYDLWKIRRDRDFRYEYFDESMKQSMADISYILDHLDELNKEHFEGKVKTQSVILMGHSFGGNVAHTMGFQDQRVKAVVDIDSKITERKIFGRIGVPANDRGVPVLFIRATRQYQEDVGDQLAKIKKADILPFNVQHSAFQDTAYLLKKAPSLGKESTWSQFWRWFFKSGPIFDPVDTDLSGQNVDNWYNELRLEIVGWLSYIKA